MPPFAHKLMPLPHAARLHPEVLPHLKAKLPDKCNNYSLNHDMLMWVPGRLHWLSGCMPDWRYRQAGCTAWLPMSVIIGFNMLILEVD